VTGASGGVIPQKTVEHLANSASVKKPAADVGGLSFEGALGELEDIVKSLERGDVDLEDSIALYERGQALKGHCEAKLKSAEGRLEKLVLGSAGPVGSESMDA
jgi:exodeoxyribonuclease VII small subunit